MLEVPPTKKTFCNFNGIDIFLPLESVQIINPSLNFSPDLYFHGFFKIRNVINIFFSLIVCES
jgi:hypothetical protein